MPEELSALIPQMDRERMNKLLTEMEQIREVIINNDADFQKANDIMNYYKGEIKKLEKDREEMKKPYYTKYKYVLDTYNGVIKKVQNLVNNSGAAMGFYKRKKDREAEEVQAKLDAEARKKREIETERAKHDLEVAEKLRAEGKETSAEKREADAETHIDKAAETVAPVVEKLEAGGTYFVKEYEAVERDKKAAIEHMVKDKTLITYLNIDLKKLGKKQKADNGTLEIPGINFIVSEKPRKKGSF